MLEREILLAIESLRTPNLTAFFTFITHFGEETILMAILCWLLWCYQKDVALRVGINFFAALTVNQILKITFCVSRPWIRYPETTPVAAAVPAATGFSFPSGHTAGALAVYGALAQEGRKRWLRAVWVALIALVAFSRVYLGVHTPNDVIASLVIGVALLIIVQRLDTIIRSYTGKKITLIITVAATIGVLIAYVLLKPYPAGTSVSLKSDSMKTLGAVSGAFLGVILEKRFVNYHIPESTRSKILVYLPGLLGNMIIMAVSKPIFRALLGTLGGNFVRYAFVSLWTLSIYPAIFDHLLRKKTLSKTGQANA